MSRKRRIPIRSRGERFKRVLAAEKGKVQDIINLGTGVSRFEEALDHTTIFAHRRGRITLSNPEDRVIEPRLLRLRDAPAYLGMDRNRFNREVRPLLTTIPIGRQGLAFDRLELDAWVEDYKKRNGRPAERRNLWDARNLPASRKEAGFGGLTRELKDTGDWRKVAKQAISKKRKAI